MREFWFTDKRDLDHVADIIAAEFGVALVGDAENRYEWFEGESKTEGLRFNISRAHAVSRTSPVNPTRVALGGPQYQHTDLPLLGQRLARCLDKRVVFGNVTYLGGDEFRFEEYESYLPPG